MAAGFPRASDSRESLTFHFNKNHSGCCVGNKLQGTNGRNVELTKKLIKLFKQEMTVAWTRKEAVEMARNAQILDMF